MNKNEEIIISSDDENDFIHRIQQNYNTAIKNKANSYKSSNCLNVSLKNIQTSVGKNKLNQTAPEIVDLVDYSEKSNDDNKCTENQLKHHQNNPMLDVIEIDGTPPSPETNTDVITENGNEINQHLPSDIFEKCKKLLQRAISSTFQTDANNTEDLAKLNNVSNENLRFFTEFVEYCGSLETNPDDKMKLTQKLMKRYGEADYKYVRSSEFKDLIEKCRKKVFQNNLYVIAKEISDQLSYKKIIKTEIVTPKLAERKLETNSQSTGHAAKSQLVLKNRAMKKRTKIINKIVKKLDKLGEKIRELEEKEVDLSDEEDSTYVKLQRFRERFTQIYTKLCKFTNDVSDAERVFSRKICFTESKYPAINKCIETWLNKTKRFPDFSDIMKLLESQSSSLGLPSNRESIRDIATEIFRKVGSMLQRRRMYDLWDSFSGYLEDKEDPANKDPILDGVLKSNYEARVKKEQEIFQRFVELQEKQKLEPEEVPEGEESHSPADSGNEDEEEIERVEKNLNKKLDSDINRMTSSFEGYNFEKEKQSFSKTPNNTKETKNNYKNCKSLKHRNDKKEKVCFENSNATMDNKGRIKSETRVAGIDRKSNEINEDSDLEIIDVNESNLKTNSKNDTLDCQDSLLKRKVKTESTTPVKKIRLNNLNGENSLNLEVDADGKIIVGKSQVFDVHCCQVFLNNGFRNWRKEKVFKDLTNINRLMGSYRKKNHRFNLFSPVLNETFQKYSSKRRFDMKFGVASLIYEKCMLNPEKKKVEVIKSDSNGSSNRSDVRQNSEISSSEKQNNFSGGHGNGNRRDNNDDDKKKKDVNNEVKESHHEEEEEEDDDDDEDEEEEKENENETEVDSKISLDEDSNKKTEKPLSASHLLQNTNEALAPSLIKEKILMSKTKSDSEETQIPKNCLTDSEKEQKTLIQKKSASVEEVLLSKKKPVINKEEPRINLAKLEVQQEINNSINDLKSSLEINENDCCIPTVTISDEDRPQLKTTALVSAEISPQFYKMSESLVETNLQRPSASHPSKLLIKEETETIQQTRVHSGQNIFVNGETFQQMRLKFGEKHCSKTSDDERVKRFLEQSPSSISITHPRKKGRSKKPLSQAALQAFETLRNLKDISATIVRCKSDNEGDATVGNSLKNGRKSNSVRRKTWDLPGTSSWQTMTPQIVMVEGNASGFDVTWSDDSDCSMSPIKISRVWGSTPKSSAYSNSDAPGKSKRPKKNTKKI